MNLLHAQSSLRAGVGPVARLLAVVTVACLAGDEISGQKPPSPAQAAQTALTQGKLDQVDKLLEKADVSDPAIATVKARAMVARGRYVEADALLRPVAARLPGGDAALELGLLQLHLGRRAEGVRLLEGVVENASS